MLCFFFCMGETFFFLAKRNLNHSSHFMHDTSFTHATFQILEFNYGKLCIGLIWHNKWNKYFCHQHNIYFTTFEYVTMTSVLGFIIYSIIYLYQLVRCSILFHFYLSSTDIGIYFDANKWTIWLLGPLEKIILCDEHLQTFHFVPISRNVSTGTPEIMVNFVTSYYEPELLMPLVNRITKIPEVVCESRASVDFFFVL